MLRRSAGLFTRNFNSFRQNARSTLTREAREEIDKRKVFVGNVNYNATWQDVREHFETVGPVRFCNLLRDRETNRSRGSGFVEFQEQEDVDRAIEQLNGVEFMGRALNVARVLGREDRERRGEEEK